MSNLTLGDLSITGLTDIKSFTIPAKTLFPDFNDSLVKSLEPSEQLIVSKGLINLTIRSWLLRQSGQNILIDSCVGADKDRPNHPNWHKRDGVEWLEALDKEGLKPEDIDIVMIDPKNEGKWPWYKGTFTERKMVRKIKKY